MQKNPFRAKSVMWSIAALIITAVFSVFIKFAMTANAATVSTALSIENVSPSFASGPSDGGSSAATPTIAGTNVTFTATGHDNNGDKYYLAICKTNAISAGNQTAPTCPGESWAISGEIDSDSEVSIIYTTSAGDQENNDWYAFLCDKNSPGTCSPSSQSTGDNGSPFKVNHRPEIGSVKIGQECDTNTAVPPGNSKEIKITNGILSGNDEAFATAVESDGKMISAGRTFNGSNYDFALTRYNTDGTLDANFGAGGKVATAIGSSDDLATSIALQDNGKILVAGYSDNGSNNDFAVVRYNYDGSLDTGFDSDGIVTTSISSGNDYGNSLAIQTDGKIVVAGNRWNGSYYDFAVIRYNYDGSLDTGFDSDGVVTTGIGVGSDYATSVALYSDGKITVGGYSYNGSNNDFAVVRYNQDGSLDTEFSGDGKVTTSMGSGDDKINSITIQSDGKIVGAGSTYNGSNNDFAVIRYNSDGTVDTGFGTNGMTPSAIGSGDDYANSVVIQNNGGIVVGGKSWNGSNYDFAITRYESDGSGVMSYAPITEYIPHGSATLLGQNNMTASSDGNYLALFLLNDNQGHNKLTVQKISPNGLSLWGNGVAINNGGDNWREIVSDGAGGAVIAWANSNDEHIYIQRVDSNGNLMFTPPKTAVDSGSCFPNNGQANWAPSRYTHFAVPDDAGGIIVDWFAPGTGLCAQRISGSGDRLWGNGVVVSTKTLPTFLVSDNNHGAFVAISDNDAELYHLNAADGSQISGCPQTVGGGQFQSILWNIISDGQGGVIIASENSNGFAGGGISVGRYGSDCSAPAGWSGAGIKVAEDANFDRTQMYLSLVGSDKFMFMGGYDTTTYSQANLINLSDGSSVWGATPLAGTKIITNSSGYHNSWFQAFPSGSNVLMTWVNSNDYQNPAGGMTIFTLDGTNGAQLSATPILGSPLLPSPAFESDGSGGFINIYGVPANGMVYSQRFDSSITALWEDLHSIVPSSPLFRWRSNNGDEASASFPNGAGVNISNLAANSPVRLRIGVSNSGADDSYQFRLEYALKLTTCLDITSWSQVPSSTTTDAFEMADSTYLTDGEPTTNVASGLDDPSGFSFTAGEAKDTSSQTSSISLNSGTFTELEYSIQATSNVLAGAAYCFRLTNAGTTASFTNMTFPEVMVTTGGVVSGFGVSGYVVTSMGTGDSYANSLALQPDGKIVAGGVSSNGTDNDFALVRYSSSGPVDDPSSFACVQTEITDADTDSSVDTVDMHVCSTNSFSNGVCTDSTLCQITGVKSGGEAQCLMTGEVPIPDAHGTYNVYVFLVDEHGFTDSFTANTQSYDVADVPPFLRSYTVNLPPAPAAGGYDTPWYFAMVSDNNGDNDIDSVQGKFFDKSVVTSTCTANENNCIINPTCSLLYVSTPGTGKTATGTDAELTAQCAGTFWYNANPSDFDIESSAMDSSGTRTTAFSAGGVSITNPPLIGLDVSEPSIAYGNISIGGTSESQSSTMANMGNQIIDILINGTQMCSPDSQNCSHSISENQQKWSETSSFDWDKEGYSLVNSASSPSASSGCYPASIAVRTDHTSSSTDKPIYWKLRIPSNQQAGSYSGQNTFTSTAGGTCTFITTYQVADTTGEGGTISLSCNAGDTIMAYDSKFGPGTTCGGGAGVDCGTCTTGSNSCNVTYSSSNCGGDCAPGESKSGNLSLTCAVTDSGGGGSTYDVSATGGESDTISLSCSNGDPISAFSSKWGVGCSECGGGAGVDCGTCTVGNSSCDVTYNSGVCGGDCHSGCYKPSSLTLTCLGTPPAGPVCGNSTTDIGETCDDGNTTSGDGCSDVCQTEPFELYVDYDSGTFNQLCSSSQPCDSINTAVSSSFFGAIAGLTSNEIPVYVRGTKATNENISNNAYPNAVYLQPWGASHPVINSYFTFYRANTTLDGFEIDGTTVPGGPPGAIYTSGANNSIIRNSYIHNYPGTGVFAHSSSNIQIYNNIFANNYSGGSCGGITFSASYGGIATNNTAYNGCPSFATHGNFSVVNGSTNTIVKQNIAYNSLGGLTYMFDGTMGVNTVNGISVSGTLYTDQTGIDFVGGTNYIASADPFTNVASATSWSTAGTGFVLVTPANYSIATPAAETQSTDYLGHPRPSGATMEAGAIENIELELYVDYSTGTSNQICSTIQPCDSINTAVSSSAFATIGSVTSNEIPIYLRGTKLTYDQITPNSYSNAILIQPWGGSHPILKSYLNSYRQNVTFDGFEIDGTTVPGGPPGAIYISGGSNTIIRNSYIHNYPGAGIYLVGASNSQIYNNIFANNKPSNNNYCGGISATGSSGIIITNNTVYEGCNTNQTSYADLILMNGATNTILKQNIVYNSLGGITYLFNGQTGVNSVNGVSVSGTVYTNQTGIDLVGGTNYIAATDPYTNAAGATSWSTAGTSFVLSVPTSYSIATPAAETQSTDYLGTSRPNGANAEAGAIED